MVRVVHTPLGVYHRVPSPHPVPHTYRLWFFQHGKGERAMKTIAAVERYSWSEDDVLLAGDLRRLLRHVPDGARLEVRIYHDPTTDPGPEGYEPVFGHVFYCA